MKPANARFAASSGFVLCAVTAVTLLALLSYNRSRGDLLGAWRLEYAGGGSAKWRTPEGKQLQSLLLWTLWIHVTPLLSALLLLAGIAGAETNAIRTRRAVGVVVSLALFTLVLWAGLLKPAFEIAP